MAVRTEKGPNGEEELVITFGDGIAEDPYSGLGYQLQVNLETKGEASVGYPITTSTTSGGTLGNPIARSARFFAYTTPGIPTGSPQSFAMLDDTGQVWESTSITGTWTKLSNNATTTGASSSDGLSYWLGFLFKTRGANIDYWNGTIWVNAWQTTLTGNSKHYMYVGTDNVLYITNNNYLASITAPAPTSFDPTSSGTYAFSVQKLQLPVEDVAISIAEVGGGNAPQSTLLVGGIKNLVYPWDKVSSSFALPIVVGEGYIRLMISVNQNAFIFTGNTTGRGHIFITNGSQADEFFKLPDYIFGVRDPYYQWGDAIFHRNNLLFGFFPIQNDASTLIQNFGYVWALDLTTKKFRAISALPVSATFVSNAQCLISTYNLTTPGFGFIAGWSDNSTSPGIGYSGTSAGIGTGSMLSDLINIGTFINKKTMRQVEYKLRVPLQSGESFTVTPILDGSVGTALTFSPTVASGQFSGVASINFQKSQWLQFAISMTGNSQSSGVTFRELRIR